jgi:LAO/AO transport system kinase
MSSSLLTRARAGDAPSLSRLISLVESRPPELDSVLQEIHAAGGRAHVIGITGAPGSGKSTLVAALVRALRRRGRTVGVVAVDPSSSLTGGALLGDRIRMQEHVLDRGVFVRSMSTRGALGGVSRATVDAVAVLDAAGWDDVIVETVGVGQDEVDIMRIAHTTAVVSVPGLGDDVQAIKAGLLEIADIHVVNKADRPEADRTAAELLSMLTLAGPPGADGWAIPVLRTVALDGTGVDELADTLAAHVEWLRGSGEMERREEAAAAARIRSIARELAVARVQSPADGTAFAACARAVARRELDPHTAARSLLDARPLETV